MELGTTRTAARLAALGELLLPRSCAGCGIAGVVLCSACRHHLREVPHPVVRERALGTKVFALGPYSDVRRNVILQMKEYNNRAVRPYIAAVVAAGLDHLRVRGELPESFALVPAPTRDRSARLRGGDPIAGLCAEAARILSAAPHSPAVAAAPAVRVRSKAPDQSRLSADERWKNMRRAVEVRAGTETVLAGLPVVIVDDVITTGSTMAATVEKLQVAGAVVRGGLVLADA